MTISTVSAETLTDWFDQVTRSFNLGLYEHLAQAAGGRSWIRCEIALAARQLDQDRPRGPVMYYRPLVRLLCALRYYLGKDYDPKVWWDAVGRVHIGERRLRKTRDESKLFVELAPSDTGELFLDYTLIALEHAGILPRYDVTVVEQDRHEGLAGALAWGIHALLAVALREYSRENSHSPREEDLWRGHNAESQFLAIGEQVSRALR